MHILTPDQRLRVFVSSTLQELAPERAAALDAIAALRLTPVLFELGARPHPPRELYRSYLEQSHVFVGIYWQSYGWVAPDAQISGLEDEYLLAATKPRLMYVKEPAEEREPRLADLLDRLRSQGSVSYKRFETADELRELISYDLAVLLTERFQRADEPVAQARSAPAQATQLFGRSQELAEIERLLRSDSVRLLTITGPGGIGKTRLAVEAAHRLGGDYPDGVAFVPLEGLDSAALVEPTVAAALGIRDGGGEPLERLASHLRTRHILLVLDNFEHVVEAAPSVALLLEAAPQLTVLVTSRELLRLRGEHELRVPPLAADSEAVALFMERATAAHHGLRLQADEVPVVTEICRRLDGVPLAIELAAPQMRLLTPVQLLDRLSERIALSGPRDAPERQQTLEAAIAWSYELLEPCERRLFERLGVFRGSFTIAAAEAVLEPRAGEEAGVLALIGSLLDKSMLYRVEAEESRFAMLSMIREFAQARLEQSADLDDVLAEIARFYVNFSERCETGLRSADQRVWKRRIDLEADTLRMELGWLVRQGRGDELVTILCRLWPWYWLSGQLEEGSAWVGRAVPFADQLDLGQQAWIYCLDGLFAFFRMDLAKASERVLEARSMFKLAGDHVGVATADTIIGFAAGALVGEAAALEQLSEALATFEEIGDTWSAAGVLSSLCRIRSIFGHYEGERELFERSLADAERSGDDLLIVLALTNLADFSFATGDPDGATSYLDRALEIVRATGVRYGLPDILETQAKLFAGVGAYEQAAELVGAAGELRKSMVLPLWGPIAERHERFVAELRDELAPQAFDDALTRGRNGPVEQWIESAAGSAGAADDESVVRRDTVRTFPDARATNVA